MGLLSKIWKGVKTGASGIVKGIKGVIKSFGKFMGEIGVVGQIAMAFILPAVGKALFEGMTGFIGQSQVNATASAAGADAVAAAEAAGATAAEATAAGAAAEASTLEAIRNETFTGTLKDATGMFASDNAITRGTAHLIDGSFRFASRATNVYGNISRGVTDFLFNVGKGTANIFGFDYELTPIFGEGGRFEKFSNLTKDPNQFGKAIEKAVEETVNPDISTPTPSVNVDAGAGTPPPVNVDAVNVKDVSLLDDQTKINTTPPIDVKTDLSQTQATSKVASDIGIGKVNVENEGFFQRVATNLSKDYVEARERFLDDPFFMTTKVLGVDQAIKGITMEGLSRSIFGDPESPNVYNTVIPDIMGNETLISAAEPDMRIPDANAILSATQNYGMYGSPAYMKQYIQQYPLEFMGGGRNLLASS